MDHYDLTSYGREIRARVLQWTGLPVCVGIATTKTLAKLANKFAKKRTQFGGVCDLRAIAPVALDAMLEATPLDELWGIGRRLAPRLEACGIRNARELRDAPPKRLREIFSVVLERMVFELRGISCLALEEVVPARKEIVVSRAFGQPLTDIDKLLEAATVYATRAAEKLRRQGSVTRTLSVFAHTSLFNPHEPYYSASTTVHLSHLTDDTRDLIDAVARGLKAIYRPGYRYAKCGVMLLDLHDVDVVQTSFLDAPRPREESTALMRAVDKINARMGRDTIGSAGAGRAQSWGMQRQRLSPAYTTRWRDLPIVRAG